jgi:zinc transport system substrate-binding protein
MMLRVIIALLLVACGNGRDGSSQGSGPTVVQPDRPLLVTTVNDPLRYFAERIGGEDVEVRFAATPEVVDPATFRPTTDEVVAAQAADLLILNGGGYAKWVEGVSLREARLLDASSSFVTQMIPLKEAVTHGHGPQGEHVHAGMATTFWLDLDLARAQTRAILERFVAERPERAAAFRARHVELDAELVSLDAQVAGAADRLQQEAVVFSHPVYQYLASRYRLVGRSVHWEPEEAPSDAMWGALDELLESHPARIMLWEAEPLAETSARLAQRGIAVVVYEPAGGRAREGDFMTRMRANAARLAAVSK